MAWPGIDALDGDALREALRLLGVTRPGAARAQAARALRELVGDEARLRGLLERAPDGARAAFRRLALDGPASVEALLGRGWWGRGLLPEPLDWLQRRGLVLVADDGSVHATAEAAAALRAPALDLPSVPPEPPAPVDVMGVRAVVVAADPATLERAVAVPGAALRAVAPTVAVSAKPPPAVSAALRAAGVALAADRRVPAQPRQDALPGASEQAVGPRAIRQVLDRAAAEGRQVRLRYYASSRGGAATERTVDPWTFGDDLLRGYCHLRAGERTFALDRIGLATLLPTPVEHPRPT